MKTFSLDWNYFSFTQMKKCLHVSKLKWEGDLLLILRVINFSCFSSQWFHGARQDTREHLRSWTRSLTNCQNWTNNKDICLQTLRRQFCSGKQNYCGQILYSRMNFQRDTRRVSIPRFPLNFNSEAVSWYSKFPPGVRMKSTM